MSTHIGESHHCHHQNYLASRHLKCDITLSGSVQKIEPRGFYFILFLKKRVSSPHTYTKQFIMLRHSVQRISSTNLRKTSLKSFAAAYTTSMQPSAKPIAPGIQQAENRTTTWSKTQQAKADAMVGPRFEQMDINTQVHCREKCISDH
jgi:hypothetical protein